MELTVLAAEENQIHAYQEVGGRHLWCPYNNWAVVHGAAGKSLCVQFKVVVVAGKKRFTCMYLKRYWT
jgi:hypothetical protein